MNPETDPKILAAQQHCSHSFIRGAADAAPICARCGVPKAEWEKRQQGAPYYGGVSMPGKQP